MKKKFWLTALLAVALLCGAALADTYFCSNCAKTQYFEVQSETYINDDYHETVWICEICGDPYKMNADHYGGTATCTQKAVCDGCKGEYGDLAPHSFTTKASGQLASAATCTEAAKYYAQCDNCGAVSDMVTVSVGDPAGHKWLWASFYDGTHQATCAECGTRTEREAHTVPEGMGVACVEEGTIWPVCGHDYDSGIGHDWQSNGDGTHSCTRCDVAAEACTGGEATCEHGAICET